MIVEEGPSSSGDISWTDRVIWAIILSTYSTTPKKTGATTQAPSKASNQVAAQSDQSVGQVGPLVEEWNPERFARMCAEF